MKQLHIDTYLVSLCLALTYLLESVVFIICSLFYNIIFHTEYFHPIVFTRLYTHSSITALLAPPPPPPPPPPDVSYCPVRLQPPGASSSRCFILQVLHPPGASSSRCFILQVLHPPGASSSRCFILQVLHTQFVL